MTKLCPIEILINNVPDEVKNQYMVIHIVEGRMYFYGADNNYTKAKEVAENIGGMVVLNPKYCFVKN